jgi:hypothetical protein
MRDWEACRHRVEAAIPAAPAKRDGFQPRVPKADTVSNRTRVPATGDKTVACGRPDFASCAPQPD